LIVFFDGLRVPAAVAGREVTSFSRKTLTDERVSMIQPDFFRRWNLWMCALGCLVWCGAPRAAFAQVTVTPATSISSAMQRNPAGTTYLITAGVHRLEQVTPRDGDKFIGEPGAILSGAKLLTGFTREGSNWAAAGQTQRGPVSGQCDAQHPRCG